MGLKNKPNQYYFFENNNKEFKVLKLKVKTKRGTYMRVLARELGGLALSIVRG
jgi:tRNA U55 pseudouridine synthase TruB